MSAIIYDFCKYKENKQDYRDPELEGEHYEFKVEQIVKHSIVTTVECFKDGAMYHPEQIHALIMAEIEQVKMKYISHDVSF